MPIYITVLVSQEESGLQLHLKFFANCSCLLLMVEDFQVMQW